MMNKESTQGDHSPALFFCYEDECRSPSLYNIPVCLVLDLMMKAHGYGGATCEMKLTSPQRIAIKGPLFGE